MTLLTCEHASAAVPEGLDLGVPPAVLDTHVAFDAGAADAAAALAAVAGAPLIPGRFSRLVADLNRSEDNPEVIPATAFGIAVPGNRGLTEAARRARLDTYWRPHREAVAAAVRERIAVAGVCLHVAVHSFTPALDPDRRSFSAGVLFDPSRSLERLVAGAMLDALGKAGLDARANEPYAGVADGLTTALRRDHADATYAGIELELNQAFLASPAAIPRVAAALAPLL